MLVRWSPSSPYARKVLVVAREVGVLDRIERVATNVRSPTAALLTDNPLGKIPVLVLDDGTPLVDSRVACEYLDSLNQGRKLFPPEGKARWRALRLQAIADGLMDAGLLLRYEKRRPEAQQSSTWVELQRGKMIRALEEIARDVALEGELTIGTLTAAVALSYLDFRYPEIAWPANAWLREWYARVASRPSFVESALREKNE